MKEVAIGIDIGGTNTKLGFVDRSGTVISETSFSTIIHRSFESYFQALNKQIEKLIDALAQDIEIKGIGIGAPNANYYTGNIENAVNLNWKGRVEIARMMRERYNIPVIVTNDANAAAVGEMVYGEAKDMKNFIMITLGTGLGSGLVANGQVIYGQHGTAGELGHITVNEFGRHCACGKRGCLETYVSATGIKRTVYKMLSDFNGESELASISFEDLTAEMITQAALRKDRVALEAFEYTGKILGMKLADSVAHTEPEAIFLFGGLSNAREFIFEPTQRHLEAFLMPIFRGKVKLLPSGLQEKNAAILGASALVWQEIALNEI
jgi:glucokinase